MTQTKRPLLTTTASLLLVVALLMSLTGGLVSPGGMNTGGDEYILNSVIKTQSAADALQRAGGLRGIDVSKYQGTIDWTQVANTDVHFAFVRSTYGHTDDPYFEYNVQQAGANGVKVGAYHFATFKTSAEARAEAEYFVTRLKQVNLTYPAVLDLEGNSHKSIPRAQLTSMAKEFMDIVKDAGYNVMLYSYNNFFRDHLDLGALQGYDLWIANYLEQPTAANHKVWQHTASGSVSGIRGNVDINIAYEDLSNSRTIKVNKAVSDSVKQTLNDRYDAGLPMDGLNMSNMNHAIATGIQYEINRQWDTSIPITGYLGQTEVEHLDSVYWDSNTGGNLTYLLQAKLLYKGYYQGELTARFDVGTMDAIEAFQRANNITATGYFDWDTLWTLLV